MNNPFRRFFEEDEDFTGVDREAASEVIVFGNTAYFQKFMAYLEHEADRPIDIVDQVSMIKSAQRCNTFKEIKSHLKKQLRDAQAILDRE